MLGGEAACRLAAEPSKKGSAEIVHSIQLPSVSLCTSAAVPSSSPAAPELNLRQASLDMRSAALSAASPHAMLLAAAPIELEARGVGTHAHRHRLKPRACADAEHVLQGIDPHSAYAHLMSRDGIQILHIHVRLTSKVSQLACLARSARMQHCCLPAEGQSDGTVMHPQKCA